MLNIVSTFLKKLRKDNSYTVDPDYTFGELFSISKVKLMMFCRGFFTSLFRKRISSKIFISRGVKIVGKKRLKMGSGCVLEKGCVLECISKNGISLKDGVTIGYYTVLKSSGALSSKGVGIAIGNNSAIGAHSFIGGQGGVEIGNDVIIGPGLGIYSANHIFSDKEIKIRLQGESKVGVEIGNNCWLGANVTILDGVSIGEGTVIGANSLITKNIPPYSIVIGNPGKVVKMRG